MWLGTKLWSPEQKLGLGWRRLGLGVGAGPSQATRGETGVLVSGRQGPARGQCRRGSLSRAGSVLKEDRGGEARLAAGVWRGPRRGQGAHS